MSLNLIATTEFSNVAFQDFFYGDLDNNAFEDDSTIGGILSNSKHIWQAKGPCLEVRNIQTTHKLGSWRFGAITQESNIKITAVEELKRSKGPLPLLVIALNCAVNKGIIAIFDIFGSTVLRTVHIRERITSLHVIDSDGDKSVVPDSSPLKYFDGIVAVGTHGGNVLLLDICKELCENIIENMDATVRDELTPCPMVILTKDKVGDIKKYVERSVEREEHLAIHLNVVADNYTEHFILKGENGDDRVHVDRTELEVSSLFYSARMASLLVGYNFGAFQAWDLRSLNLIYTSPICEGNIPITHFTTQEPADDPRAYFYIWVSYSHNHLFRSGLSFAVMYSFVFARKIFLKGYGNIYENFNSCAIGFQLELGDTQSSTCDSPVKGGLCLGFQSLNKCISNKDQSHVALCFISWLFWDANKEVNTAFLLFDLNQWYKEQMPRVPRWSHCSNYLIKNSVGELLFDIKIDQKSLVQFMGLQRLEQHFCPTALSFDLQGITKNAILKFHNKSIQRLFLDKVADSQHLALLRPDHFFEQISTLGLTPLFCDYPSLNSSLQIDDQREFLLSVALEQRLVGWLCQATTKLANNAFSSSGLTIYNILNWAFHRAIVLKNSLYQYCVPLFDYSGTRLDDNTLTMLSAGTNQMRNLCSLYRYISNKLVQFVADGKQLLEEQRSLEHLVTYFEVVLWMTNVGLLPECRPRGGFLFNLVSAPYLIDDLREYYSNKREELQLASKETFVEKDCLLFIDNMINNQTEGKLIRQQWQEDGGTGLYPPPSLQSVLRIYLLDGIDVTFKHSFVTYTLLDIAMTVDEHNTVVKLLLKFPQIFNLSQSIIKIVQAFWHLDHDDYDTALESILDPSVLVEDLQPWHHSAMMRSLLMQNQPGLALLYLQIRKPPIQEEKDLLTVVSLLISKSMLDEAFKFRDQHKETANESALLTHIFNECNKNELLHTLLYRSLNTDEEKAFFKYLQGNRNPKYEDLQVFYYLLRSRFLEAFDSYSLSKRKQPSAQGLIGQRDATTTDNVVKMFKNLLPDVNRNLVETVRKERSNLWKEVPRPTPLSVFVHNPKDQIYYKSSIIFAALSKAKQTFNDAADKTGAETEETPFLRTPRMFTRKSVQNTPVLKCRVVEQKETEEEYGPSPSKKFRLSPRAPMATPIKKKMEISNSVQYNLHTPIVKRRRKSLETTNTPAILPQSILKTRTFLEDSLVNENSSTNSSLKLECENSIAKSRFALTRRKAIGTPLKSHVKFNDLPYSTNSEDPKGKSLNPQDDASTSLRGISPTTSVDTNDFYCPDLTLEEQENVIAGKCSTPLVKSKTSTRNVQRVSGQLPEVTVNIARKAKIPIEENDLSTNRLNYQSPKARRSYKRSFGVNVSPVRSSPRLSKKSTSESTQETCTTSPLKLLRSAKLQPRKSLARSVLEHNTFSKLNDDESVFEVTSKYNETGGFPFSSISSESINLDSEDSFRLSDLSFGKDSNNADASFTSKTTEVRSMEVSRTSVQYSRTGELMEQNESRKYVSKTVEVFTDEVVEPKQAQLKEDGNRTGPITIDEELANSTMADSIGDISTQEQGSYSKASQENAIKVYEDLSSGSEDMIQVIQDIKDAKAANKQIDRSSTSKRNTERKIQDISPDTLATVDYDPVLSANDDGQEPSHKQSYVNESNIIEIASGSEDELNVDLSLETDEESNFRLHISRSSNRSPVVANEFEKSEAISEENDSDSRNDLEDNNETQNSDKYERSPICIDSSRESHEDCPEEFAVVQVHANPEKQPVSVVDHRFDESNRQITPSSTAEVTSIKEPTKILEKCDESTDEENSVYGSPNNNTQEPDDPSTGSNKRSISIQCTLAVQDLESSNSGKALTINDSEECVELSEHQRSISVQCTLHEKDEIIEKSVKVEEYSPEMVLKTVKKTYKKRQALVGTSAAQDTDDILPLPVESQESTSEHQRSTSAQTILADDNPVEDAESDEETMKEKISSPAMVLRTVRKSYKGPKRLLDLDATPKLALHLLRRTYSRNTNINLFGDSNTEKSNDNLPSITASEDIVVTGDKPDNSQENKFTEETDNEKLVKVEIISNIAKTVEPRTAKTLEATPKLSILTKKTYSKNTDGRKCSENADALLVNTDDENAKTTLSNTKINDGVNAVPLKRKLLRKQSSLISDKKAKSESKTGKTPSSKPTTLVTRKRSTRGSQDELIASGTLIGSADSERITTRRNSAVRSDPKAMSSVTYAAERSKTTRKKNIADFLPVVDDAQLVSNTSHRTKRSHDLEQEDALQADSIEDPPINEGASTSKDILSDTAGKGESKAASLISTYSMSRRLTRQQAKMLESMSVEGEIGNMPIMEQIDPVQLLDKPEFKGKRDPDESKVYERSPSTGSEASRQTRSSSVISQNLVGVTTPKSTRAERASSSGVKFKKSPIDLATPKISDDMAALEQNTPSRTGLRTRSRTNSVSSIQSDNSDVSNSSVRTTRSRSSRITKAQLPEIEEEKMKDDSGSSPKSAKKVGRKRKH